MGTKHTPGPWEARRDPCHFGTLSSVVGGGDKPGPLKRALMIEVGGFADARVQEANTRLIAAAPCLLEAANRALSWFLDHAGVPWDHDEAIIRAQQKDAAVCSLQSAIAKAKGETK